jgi:ribonuclease E
VAAAVGAGRGRGVGTPACATANEWGRLRGSGIGPAMGSDAASASATGATGEADANGVVGGSGQTLLDTRSGDTGRALGARLAAGGAEIAGGGAAAGLDIAILLEVVGIGAGVGGATGGVLGAIAIVGAALFWLPEGTFAAAFIVGIGGSSALFVSAGVGAGGLFAGIVAVCSGAGTGDTAMVWIVGGLTGPM